MMMLFRSDLASLLPKVCAMPMPGTAGQSRKKPACDACPGARRKGRRQSARTEEQRVITRLDNPPSIH
jgi:hypothetical protein